VNEHERQLAVTWIVGRDTGLSSKCIWAVMMGQPMAEAQIPYDLDDFGRCWRLLALIPRWRMRLQEMADRYTEWVPLVREWEALEAIYEPMITTTDADYKEALGKRGYQLLCRVRGEIEHNAMPEVSS